MNDGLNEILRGNKRASRNKENKEIFFWKTLEPSLT